MPTKTTDLLEAIQADQEERLRATLVVAGPVVALDTDKTVAELTYTATVLRQVLAANQPMDLELTPESVAAWFSDQLQKEAAVLERNAVAKATAARHLATDQWKAVCDRERKRRR